MVFGLRINYVCFKTSHAFGCYRETNFLSLAKLLLSRWERCMNTKLIAKETLCQNMFGTLEGIENLMIIISIFYYGYRKPLLGQAMVGR